MFRESNFLMDWRRMLGIAIGLIWQSRKNYFYGGLLLIGKRINAQSKKQETNSVKNRRQNEKLVRLK